MNYSKTTIPNIPNDYPCPVDNLPCFLTASQIAGLVEVHPNTIRNWCDKNLIHHMTRNGWRRFCVMAIIEARNIQITGKDNLPLEKRLEYKAAGV